MKALRITLKRLREVLGLLKMLDAEFRKIKRQKFVLFTILAACLFPIPLTVLMVHAKLSYNVLFMFVLEFGFFLVLPIVLGIIAAILFHMENENGTLKNLSIIPVPRWKLLCAKVLVIYILAVFYGIAAIGAILPMRLHQSSILQRKQFILLEQIRTIDKQRLKQYMGMMPDNIMARVDKALAISISLKGGHQNG